MKNMLFILFFSFFACLLNLHAQDDGFGDRHGVPRVAFFIDSVFVGSSLGIDSKLSDSSKLVKEPIEIDGVKYDARIYIKYKRSPELLTLDQVRKKYIQKKTYNPIYLINHQFVKENVSQV